MNLIQEQAINDIMDNFDFSQVHNIMVYMDWKWALVGIPEVDELRGEARRLLETAANSTENDYFVATGGFVVNKHSQNYFSLQFVLVEWDNFHSIEGQDQVDQELRDRVKSKFSYFFAGIEP
jgi:hypothetical protein